jgi:hypothetical protein
MPEGVGPFGTVSVGSTLGEASIIANGDGTVTNFYE